MHNLDCEWLTSLVALLRLKKLRGRANMGAPGEFPTLLVGHPATRAGSIQVSYRADYDVLPVRT